ncbi:MAG: hypothetical protein Q8O19_02815 [Rectinemataceae bacterium]|nr:hypothetical protein [Rectinemataceae bacterium]
MMNDFNHAIYNNYSNIDGEGQWDGSKWNVYAGLNIRAGAGKTSAMFVGPNGVGIGTTAPVGKLHVAGSHAGGIMSDGNDRAGVGASGHYPQFVAMAGGTGNTNHGPTVMLGAFDAGTSGAHKHWSIGTAGQNATFLDIGYHAGTDTNPHAGVRNYNGTTFMTILNSGNVGIGTLTPTQKLTVAGVIESTSGGVKFPDGTTQTTAGPRVEAKTVRFNDNEWTNAWELTPDSGCGGDDGYGGIYKIQCSLNGATCMVGASQCNSGNDQSIGNPGQVSCAVGAHATYQAALIEVQVRGAWNAKKYLYIKVDHRDEYENSAYLDCKVSRITW